MLKKMTDITIDSARVNTLAVSLSTSTYQLQQAQDMGYIVEMQAKQMSHALAVELMPYVIHNTRDVSSDEDIDMRMETISECKISVIMPESGNNYFLDELDAAKAEGITSGLNTALNIMDAMSRQAQSYTTIPAFYSMCRSAINREIDRG